jgi:hypothetical protein
MRSVLVLSLLMGCATMNIRYALRAHVEAHDKVGFVRVPGGTLKHPCTLKSEDGQTTIAEGEFDARALFQVGAAFTVTPGEFDKVTNWGDLFILGMATPFNMTCGNEQFHARVYFGALPRQFLDTPTLHYNIEIGESAWTAARNGYVGYALSTVRWGYGNSPIQDRTLWMIVFTKGPFPPLTDGARTAGEVAHTDLAVQ